MPSSWGYVVLCLAAPVLWGIVSVRVWDWCEARFGGSRNGATDSEPPWPTDMYEI